MFQRKVVYIIRLCTVQKEIILPLLEFRYVLLYSSIHNTNKFTHYDLIWQIYNHSNGSSSSG